MDYDTYYNWAKKIYNKKLIKILDIFEESPLVKLFLDHDRSCLFTGKYDIASAILYIIKADIPENMYTPKLLITALLLNCKHELKAAYCINLYDCMMDIFETSEHNSLKIIFNNIDKLELLLLTNYSSAIITQYSCDVIISLTEEHWIWKRLYSCFCVTAKNEHYLNCLFGSCDNCSLFFSTNTLHLLNVLFQN